VARRRRSLHFVPGGNDRMLAKALTLPADGLILDLEDAVAPDRKAVTRGAVREWLGRKDFGGRERWVRMNPIATPLGRAVTGDAESYRYLVESIRKFPRPNIFAGMIRDAGFSRVKWESLSGGIVALHSGWRL